jgi:hypothetical protein
MEAKDKTPRVRMLDPVQAALLGPLQDVPPVGLLLGQGDGGAQDVSVTRLRDAAGHQDGSVDHPTAFSDLLVGAG